MRVPGRCGDHAAPPPPSDPMTKTGTIHIPFQAPSGSATMYSAPQTLSSEVQDLRCARARDGASLCTASPRRLSTRRSATAASQKLHVDPVLTSQAKGVENFPFTAKVNSFSPTRAPMQRQVTGTGCGDFDRRGWEVPRGWG
jgi:hypothetical protein